MRPCRFQSFSSPLRSSKEKTKQNKKKPKCIRCYISVVSCLSSSYRQRTGEAVGVNEGWEAAPPWSAAEEEIAGFRGGGAGLRQKQAWSQTWRAALSPAARDQRSPRRETSAAGPGRRGCWRESISPGGPSACWRSESAGRTPRRGRASPRCGCDGGASCSADSWSSSRRSHRCTASLLQRQAHEKLKTPFCLWLFKRIITRLYGSNHSILFRGALRHLLAPITSYLAQAGDYLQRFKTSVRTVFLGSNQSARFFFQKTETEGKAWAIKADGMLLSDTQTKK